MFEIIIEKICDVLGVGFASIALWETIRLNRKITSPKVKINLERINDKDFYCYHNLIIQNISDYNLYEFNLRLKEFDDMKVDGEGIKECMRILNETVPVFTIGQVYDTFLINVDENKHLKELNFNVTYRMKPNGKIKKENVVFNINTLRNIYLKIN